MMTTIEPDPNMIKIASASPDPKVRAIALRRMKIADEINIIDDFLAMYGAEAIVTAKAAKTGAEDVNAEKRKTPGRKPGSGNGGAKTVALMTAISEIIVARGAPMSLADLHTSLLSKRPDICPSTPDSLRSRLNVNRNTIFKNKKGYWPANVEQINTDE